jgi:hypothetical protein
VAVFSAGGGPRCGAAAAVCRRQQHSILNDMGQINLPQVVTAGDIQTAGVDAVGTGGAGQAEVCCPVIRVECEEVLRNGDDGVGVGGTRNALPSQRVNQQQVNIIANCRYGEATTLGCSQCCLRQPPEKRGRK